jgi:hypothetical protein
MSTRRIIHTSSQVSSLIGSSADSSQNVHVWHLLQGTLQMAPKLQFNFFDRFRECQLRSLHRVLLIVVFNLIWNREWRKFLSDYPNTQCTIIIQYYSLAYGSVAVPCSDGNPCLWYICVSLVQWFRNMKLFSKVFWQDSLNQRNGKKGLLFKHYFTQTLGFHGYP